MTIQQLEQIIAQLSGNDSSKRSAITQDLADYAQLKYGSDRSEDERKIIDTVKEKLLIGYYNMPNHSYVTKRPDYKGKFGLDKLEMDALEQAADELETEKLIEGNDNYVQLTDKGVLAARKLINSR